MPLLKRLFSRFGWNFQRWLIILLGLALLLSACNPQVAPQTPASSSRSSVPAQKQQLRGLVLDLNGSPIAGAKVSAQNMNGVTGSDGWFTLDTGGTGQWVTVSDPNFIARTRAVRPGNPTLFRLTPQDGKTISLLFTGDVMFGRRFFDPNEDGDFSDGLLPENPTLQDHLNLIDSIRPLLEDADLTVINFESAISDDPSLNYLQARPSEYHQEKDYIYSSHPSALLALKQAGVDVVDVGNNHVYDLLDPGVRQTLDALSAAGFISGETFFGMGMNEAAAWKPAVVEAEGQKLGFVGCTSITDSPAGGPSYVAVDSAHKGGAASCSNQLLKSEINGLLQAGPSPIAVLHGGHEYERTPSEFISEMAKAARESGAALIIGHHPHVISGLDWDGQSLAAWSLGNFIFDQTLWPTFESMVLVVHMRDGKVIHAHTEPLIIADYIPTGVTGEDAEYVTREIAGHSSAGFVMEDGSMESDFAQQAVTQSSSLRLKNDAGAAQPVSSGEWLSAFQGEGTLRLGRDLLWVGDFEDDDIDAQTGEDPFWDLSGPDKATAPAYAYEGQSGAHLERGAGNLEPAVLTPTHRQLVKEGDELTVSGMGRASGGGPVELQLSWFADTKGPSADQTTIPLHLTKDWMPFSVDAKVPKGIVAVGLYLKLQPPARGTASVDFDNLHLIQWAAPDAAFSPLYDFYRLQGSGVLTFERDVLPGWDLFEKATGE